MAIIILDGLTLHHVVAWESSEKTSVSVQGFVNKATPTVSEDVWNRKPERIIIVCRESDADKWTIEQSANGLASVVLSEDGSTTTVWIARIRSHYEYKKTLEAAAMGVTSWLMEIELIVVG